jgi:hypothetical protein
VKARTLARAGAWLAAAWAGAMAGIGGIAAPALFQLLQRTDAGWVAGRLFSVEATAGLCVGAILVLVGLQLGRLRAEAGRGGRFGAELVLALAAVACIVAGHYALLPLLEAAREGKGSLSFGALHALSSAFFALRFVLVAALAWRLTAPSP